MNRFTVLFLIASVITASASGADRFQSWLKEEVNWIISEKEKQAFRSLKTAEEKEEFIEDFWKRRDPTPDTPGNEYREQHYNRLKYADENFREGILGRRTDRGRVFIIHGPPVSHSQAVAENREIWSYSSNPYAEYYRGPVVLVFERGAQVYQNRQLSESREGQSRQAPGQVPGLLAQRPSVSARYRLISAGPGSGGQILSSAGETDRHIADYFRSPGELLEEREEAAQRRRETLRVARQRVATDVSAATLEFSIGTTLFATPEGGTVLFAFELPPREAPGAINIDILCEISDSASGRVIDSLEETVSAFRPDQPGLPYEPLRFSGRFEVLAGDQELMCLAREVDSGALGVARTPVTVTALDRNKLAVTGLLLTQDAQPVGEGAEGLLVFEDARFLPNPASTFEPAQPLFLFFQVFRPGEEPAELYFDYQISDPSQVHFRSPMRVLQWGGDSELTSHAFLLDLSSFSGGSYSLLLKVFDKATGEYSLKRTTFRLEGTSASQD